MKADAGKIPELKRVIVGYEDNIAMERTLDRALQKIFPELSGTSHSTPSGFKNAESKTKEKRNLTLSKTDYEKIQRFYKKVLKSQNKLDQSLHDYKKELKALGEVLQETPFKIEPVKPSVK